MANGVLAAAAMSVAAKLDPQFRLPRKPRLAPGLVTVSTDNGVLVEGGPSRQLLGGQGAQRVITDLAPLLDGTRDLETLARDFGEPLDTTHAAVSLLYASGLLEDGADEPDVTGFDPQAHRFYARSIDSTRVNPSGAHAIQRLQTSTIAVIGDEDAQLTNDVATHLLAGGIGEVCSPTSLIPSADLVVLIGDTPNTRDAARLAQDAGIPIFPVLPRGRYAYFGPVVDITYTPTFAEIADRVMEEPTTPAAQPDTGVLAALAAADILSVRSRVGTPLSKQVMMQLDLDTVTLETRVAIRPTIDGAPLAYAFEASTAFPPRHLGNPRDHQVHYKQSNILLQRESKQWPSAPMTPLPERRHPGNDWPTLNQPASAPKLPFATLADILLRTAGNRNLGTPVDGKVRRWAATGGNLGSAQAYVIARRVDGLEPGVYGYDRGSDALARLTWADANEQIHGVDSNADVTLIFTGALGRVATKYSAFSWRIVHLDAGVAVYHARSLAAAHGLSSAVAPAWDDEGIGELLGIDQTTEPITAVVSITTARGTES